ncbi:MAG: hypothetical protein KC800_17450, partial [Candidatus Eremiobacteraeota bacterium]|nr:hypothetical protein [Candidatus Eremiobacteraeota bacterium]
MSRCTAVLLILFLLVGCRPAPDAPTQTTSPQPETKTSSPSPLPPSELPTPSPTPEGESLEEQIARLEKQNSSVEVSVATSRSRENVSRSNLEPTLPGPGESKPVADSELTSLEEQARSTGSAAH